MPDRIFRLLERLQRLDHFLRFAQGRRVPDPLELLRLRVLKRRIMDRILALRPREGGGLGQQQRPLSSAQGLRLRGDAGEFGIV